MSIFRTTRLPKQISNYADALRPFERQIRSIHVASVCKAKAEPVTIHVRSTNTKKGKGQSRDSYTGQGDVKGGKKDSLWKSWQNLTLGTKMGVAFAIGREYCMT